MDLLFGLLTVSTVPWWLSMLLFPESRATIRMVASPWPFVALGGVYAALALAAVIAGGPPASLDASDLSAALATPTGFLTAWAHMLALDLFAGVWIFRDARFYGRLPRLELIATWWAGPLGVALYLWRRRRWAGPDPNARVVN